MGYVPSLYNKTRSNDFFSLKIGMGMFFGAKKNTGNNIKLISVNVEPFCDVTDP